MSGIKEVNSSNTTCWRRKVHWLHHDFLYGPGPQNLNEAWMSNISITCDAVRDPECQVKLHLYWPMNSCYHTSGKHRRADIYWVGSWVLLALLALKQLESIGKPLLWDLFALHLGVWHILVCTEPAHSSLAVRASAQLPLTTIYYVKLWESVKGAQEVI